MDDMRGTELEKHDTGTDNDTGQRAVDECGYDGVDAVGLLFAQVSHFLKIFIRGIRIVFPRRTA
jgi:hypothetical protein